MNNITIPQWLKWAREIQSLSQTGLAFAQTDYEKDRYKRLNQIAAEIIETNSNLVSENVVKVFMNQPGYATPKIDVRSAVIVGNKILLVQEKADSCWAMPGGWADVGNKPSEVAERETKEESGYDVKVKKLIGVFDANRDGRPMEFFHAFKLVFLSELTGGNPMPSDETIAVDFFEFDKLPQLSQNRTNLRHIEEIRKHIADKNRLAFFD